LEKRVIPRPVFEPRIVTLLLILSPASDFRGLNVRTVRGRPRNRWIEDVEEDIQSIGIRVEKVE
jgi:hypothetical protein